MSKKQSVKISLQAKLLFMILGIVITSIIVLSSVAYSNFSNSLTKNVYQKLAEVADNVSHQVETVNERELEKIRILSKVPEIRNPDISLEEKQALLTDVLQNLKGNYENLAFYDKDGNAITSDGRYMNFMDREYFQIPMSGKEYISDPAFSTVVNKVLQYYALPVYDFENNIIGVIVLIVNGNAFEDVLSSIDVGAGMHPSIINRQTQMTIANVNEGVDTGSEEEAAEKGPLDTTVGIGIILGHVFQGLTGQETFHDDSIGIGMIAAYQPVPNTDWSVFAVTIEAFYFADLIKMRIISIVLTVVIIILATVISIVLVGMLIRPLKSVKKSIVEISSGNADLTKRIPAASSDEIGEVVDGFNAFSAKLQTIVTDIKNSKDKLTEAGNTLRNSTRDTGTSITQIIANIESVHNQISGQNRSVEQTASAVNEIASNIESLEKMIERQSMGVSQASTAVEEMMGNIASVDVSVEKLAESFRYLNEATQNGIAKQDDVNVKIKQIESQSQLLQAANEVINNIASQTNLLAMNAAIEAAHAGDAGKGFSVVADEIRKLSETSSHQSKTIGDQLSNIRDSIASVVQASVASRDAFSSVTDRIEATDQLVQQIKGAMAEQSVGSKQIGQALHMMTDSSSEVRGASAEMTIGSKAILDEMSVLQEESLIMKNSMVEMSAGAKKINETTQSLREVVRRVDDVIDRIQNDVGQFTV